MNVEIRTEVAQFPEKEYINGIFVAVRPSLPSSIPLSLLFPLSPDLSSFLLTYLYKLCLLDCP